MIAPVQTDRTKESIQEVVKEIGDVDGGRPLAGEEYDSIMRSQVARLPGRFETLNSLIDAASDVVNTGRDPAYYYDYAQDLSSLSADALNSAAAGVVQPEQLTWIIIGDLKKVEAGIVSLGLGEVVHLDADGKVIATKP